MGSGSRELRFFSIVDLHIRTRGRLFNVSVTLRLHSTLQRELTAHVALGPELERSPHAPGSVGVRQDAQRPRLRQNARVVVCPSGLSAGAVTGANTRHGVRHGSDLHQTRCGISAAGGERAGRRLNL